MVLNLAKIVHIFEIYADLSNKYKSDEVLSLYPAQRPHHPLSENSMFYRGLSHSSRDIEEQVIA